MSTKTIQGKLWSVAPEYWSQHFEPWFLPMYKTVLNKLDLQDGQMLLDAGCGSGLFSNMAIAAGAQLIGVDAASGKWHGAATSFQYAGNFENALREAKRVLKPGGRLVIGIWDKPELSDATNVLKAIGTLLPPPPPGTPGPFALSEDGKIEGILSALDLKLRFKAAIPCPFLYSSLADGIKSFMGTGPAAAAVNNRDKHIVEETIAKAMQAYRLPDDFHFLQNQSWCLLPGNSCHSC